MSEPTLVSALTRKVFTMDTPVMRRLIEIAGTVGVLSLIASLDRKMPSPGIDAIADLMRWSGPILVGLQLLLLFGTIVQTASHDLERLER